MTRPFRPLSLMLVVAAVACGGGEPAVPEAAAASPDVNADTALLSARAVAIGDFDTARVTMRPWQDSRRVPARLIVAPDAIRPLGSIVEGRITRVHVLPGDIVRAGDVLVRIHSHEMMDARAKRTTARSARVAAEANARLAQSAADRAERLYAARALSLAELERARAARADADAMLDAARAEEARAEAMIEHLEGDGGPLPVDYDEHEVLIRAPIDGTIISRDIEEGQVVTIGQPLASMGQTSKLMLRLQVPAEASAVAVRGAQVRFTVTGVGDRTFDARVTRVAPAVDTLTRTIEVLADVRPSPALRAEMYASAELLGAATAAARSVPASAVQAFDGDTVVIVADRRGDGMRLEARRVRIGRRTAEWAEILGGADTTDAVVTRGAAIAKAEILKQRGG
jgi:cobalt-zinc-cadmium efflux system membrane fusion protein